MVASTATAKKDLLYKIISMNFDGNFDFAQPSKKTTSMSKLCVSTFISLFLTTSEPSESGADFGRNRSKIFSSKDLELGCTTKEEPSLKLRQFFFAMSVRKYQFRFEWRPLKMQYYKWMIGLILTRST